MKKPAMLLLITGSLIASGMFLTYYGSQVVTEGIVQQEFIIDPNQSEEIRIELDPKIGEDGVFAIVTTDFVEETIYAKVIGPSGIQNFYDVIDNERFEETFTISTLGTYSLILENTGQTKFKVIGAIGHVPDSSKYAMGYSGFYLLIIGLIGMAGSAVYIIKNRKKSFS